MAAQFPVEKRIIAGAVGGIEVAMHLQGENVAKAIAIVAHPHPLFGGSMDNKVVTTLTRAMFDAGAAVFRFNFRGVGKTEGVHDEGRGETDDMLTVIAFARTMLAGPTIPLWMGGFSFGGAVALAASARVDAEKMVLVAPAFERLSHWEGVEGGVKPPLSTLLIHGEKDETVALADSIAWAGGRDLAVTVVPNADHFFHQRLHIIKRLVQQHLR